MSRALRASLAVRHCAIAISPHILAIAQRISIGQFLRHIHKWSPITHFDGPCLLKGLRRALHHKRSPCNVSSPRMGSLKDGAVDNLILVDTRHLSPHHAIRPRIWRRGYLSLSFSLSCADLAKAMAQWRGIWRNGAPIEMPFAIRRRRMAKWRTDRLGLTAYLVCSVCRRRREGGALAGGVAGGWGVASASRGRNCHGC